MSATVTPIGSRKPKGGKAKSGNLACPNCGNEWFMAKVTVARLGDGSPGDAVGYVVPLRCTECGEAVGG